MKMTRQTKRKLTIRDEPTDEEADEETLQQKIIKVKKEKDSKGKGKEVESDE